MKHRRLFQQSFLAISSVFFAFPYFLMLFCCFSTDAGIKGNTLFGSLSVDHFLSSACCKRLKPNNHKHFASKCGIMGAQETTRTGKKACT